MKNTNGLKVLILVLASDKYPSPINEKAQYDTWVQTAIKNNIDVVYYKGGNKLKYERPYLTLPVDDGIMQVGYKTIEALKWITDTYEYDYVFRVNSSCYVNIPELIKFLQNINFNLPLYAGHKLSSSLCDYIIGVGILLNKKSVELIQKNENKWDHSYIDDISLGLLFKELNVDITEFEMELVSKDIFNNKLNFDKILYRCKMEIKGYPRYLDKYFIKQIHNLLTNKIMKKLNYQIFIFEILKFINIKYFYLKFLKRLGIVNYYLKKLKN
mgnify:FL=1